MTFDDILGDIEEVEIIAKGRGVDVRRRLNHRYGRGQWRKLKGFATVQFADGSVWYTEVHWYEAHGIGRVDPKEKHRIRRIA